MTFLEHTAQISFIRKFRIIFVLQISECDCFHKRTNYLIQYIENYKCVNNVIYMVFVKEYYNQISKYVIRNVFCISQPPFELFHPFINQEAGVVRRSFSDKINLNYNVKQLLKLLNNSEYMLYVITLHL